MQKNFIEYIIFMNILTFLVMWYDKREAIKQKWRVPEKSLFLLCLLGGTIGRNFRNGNLQT